MAVTIAAAMNTQSRHICYPELKDDIAGKPPVSHIAETSVLVIAELTALNSPSMYDFRTKLQQCMIFP